MLIASWNILKFLPCCQMAFFCVCVWATWDVAASSILLCQRHHAAIPDMFLCRRHQSCTGSVTNVGSGFLQAGAVLLEQQPLLNTWRCTQMVLRTGHEGDKARKELHTTGGSRNTYHKWLLMGYMVFTHYRPAMASLLYTVWCFPLKLFLIVSKPIVLFVLKFDMPAIYQDLNYLRKILAKWIQWIQ